MSEEASSASDKSTPKGQTASKFIETIQGLSKVITVLSSNPLFLLSFRLRMRRTNPNIPGSR